MTIKDVAKMAQVSPSTVSRVLNPKGKPFGSPPVQQRVWQAVRALGYTTNQQAKNLRQGAKPPPAPAHIHIVFARNKSSLDDAFFKEISTSVQAQCLKQGFALGEMLTGAEAQQLGQKRQPYPKSDGLVVLGRAGAELHPFTALFKKRVVYITLNQMETSADHVMCDGIEATRKALDYLHSNGHRHIAYVGEYPSEIRFHSFREYMSDKKLPLNAENMVYAPMTIEGGMEVALKIQQMASPPTAVFCANDSTAIGLLKGLAILGISVPKTLSVISIDNIPGASTAKPGLTTVQIPMEELGTFAVKTLADRLQKGHSVNVRVFMPTDLIIRESVAPPAASP